MNSDDENVIAAAEQRAVALANGDADELRRLMHPKMRWTTHRGNVLDRDTYVAGTPMARSSGMSSASSTLLSRSSATQRCSQRLSSTWSIAKGGERRFDCA
jgi:hypothetical protein